MPEDRGGRPTKFTEEIVTLLTKSFNDGATITEACRIAKIARKTYYEWVNGDDEFSNKMTQAQEYPDAIARMNLVGALKDKDIDTSKWWAERRMKDEFSTRSETSLSFEDIIKRADKYVK